MRAYGALLHRHHWFTFEFKIEPSTNKKCDLKRAHWNRAPRLCRWPSILNLGSRGPIPSRIRYIHPIHRQGTRTTATSKVTTLSKAYWFKEYMSLTNTAGDKLKTTNLVRLMPDQSLPAWNPFYA